MLTRLDDQYEIECDACSESETGLGTDYRGALSAARSLGWINFKKGGEYYHVCCKDCGDEI